MFIKKRDGFMSSIFPLISIRQYYNQKGYDIIEISDELSFIDPYQDEQLKIAFESADFDQVDQYLNQGANASQKIHLNPFLIFLIVKTLKNEILKLVEKQDVYEIIFESNLTAADTEEVINNFLSIDSIEALPEDIVEKLVLSELKKSFQREFDCEVEVSLLWVAVFLQDVDLVNKLLSAKKPADLFSPLWDSSPFSGSLVQGILTVSQSQKTIEILTTFIKNGVSAEYVFSGEWLTEHFLEAVDQDNLPLIDFLLDCDVDINDSINFHEYRKFFLYHKQFDELFEIFPSGKITPLALAVYNNNMSLVKALCRKGANFYQLSPKLQSWFSRTCAL